MTKQGLFKDCKFSSTLKKSINIIYFNGLKKKIHMTYPSIQEKHLIKFNTNLWYNAQKNRNRGQLPLLNEEYLQKTTFNVNLNG